MSTFVKLNLKPSRNSPHSAGTMTNIIGETTRVSFSTTAGWNVIEINSYDSEMPISQGYFLTSDTGLWPGFARMLLQYPSAEIAELDSPLPGGDVTVPTSNYTPGPFDRKYINLAFGGTLPGNEIWSCNLKLAPTVDDPTAANIITNGVNLHTWAETGVAPALLAFFTSPGAEISSNAQMTYAKLTRYGMDGKLNSDDPGESYEHVFPVGTAGGQNGPNVHPNQVACVVTLLTGFTRGPAHKGRIFLPLPNAAVDSDGQVAQSWVDNVTLASAALITAIDNSAPGSGGEKPQVVVMSRKNPGAVTRRVTGVAVGKALDTQRRRRQHVVEDYKSSAAI